MIEDNFFRTRPSSENIQEGDSVTFLERGNLIRAEKRQGVIYESILKENDTKNDISVVRQELLKEIDFLRRRIEKLET
jgi:hypothetical protein|tara:strand:+ start:894 stop:1127 length:234 start_codon:yes stop_codon:yes gene_type:complete